MGIITPTGLATDATTAALFTDTLRAGRLAAFYDFENWANDSGVAEAIGDRWVRE